MKERKKEVNGQRRERKSLQISIKRERIVPDGIEPGDNPFRASVHTEHLRRTFDQA